MSDPAKARQDDATRPISVFFRFDDYSETSPAVIERGMLEGLRAANACMTFAVIPAVTEGSYHERGDRPTQPLGAKKIQFLKDALSDGSVDVALHGYDHRTIKSGSPHSEFVGLPLADQVDKIKRGQRLFHEALDVNATVFVPPWNNYDEHTITALTANGIACLSANRYGARTDGIRYLPITADFADLRLAVEEVRRTAEPDPIIGVLLHPYDFKESGDARAVIDCQVFAQELRWLREQPDVRIRSVSDLSRTNTTLNVARYAANQPLQFEHMAPPFVRVTSSTPFLRSEGRARRAKTARAVAIVGTYLAAAAAGLLFDAALGSSLARYLAVAAFLGLTTRATVQRQLFFGSTAALSFTAGILLSALASLVRS